MESGEIIRALKDAWTRELMDEKDIVESIEDSYIAWVQGIAKAAAADLQASPAAAGGGQAQGGQQQAAPAATGGM